MLLSYLTPMHSICERVRPPNTLWIHDVACAAGRGLEA